MEIQRHQPLHLRRYSSELVSVRQRRLGRREGRDQIGLRDPHRQVELVRRCMWFDGRTITYAVLIPPFATCGVTSSHILPWRTWTWKLHSRLESIKRSREVGDILGRSRESDLIRLVHGDLLRSSGVRGAGRALLRCRGQSEGLQCPEISALDPVAVMAADLPRVAVVKTRKSPCKLNHRSDGMHLIFTRYSSKHDTKSITWSPPR